MANEALTQKTKAISSKSKEFFETRVMNYKADRGRYLKFPI